MPYFENFYSSGPSSVRGFERNTVGPKELFRIRQAADGSIPVDVFDNTVPIALPSDFDLITIGRRSVGGNAKALLSLELIFPVPFSEGSNSVRTSFFVDAGNLWNTHFNPDVYAGLNIVNSPNYDEIPDFSQYDTYRMSTGFSLQWLSPMGPLLISISKTLRSQPGDEREGFAFNVGQTF